MIRRIIPYIIGIALLSSCGGDDDNKEIPDLDFRDEMRSFVEEISDYSKKNNSNFLIVPQNGQEIFTTTGLADGPLAQEYLDAIDATGREDLFYGYDADDAATSAEDNAPLIALCDVAKNAGKVVMVTDYCSTHSKMDDSYSRNKARGYISFAADKRELTNIPAYPESIQDENDDDVLTISTVRNFLYLINPSEFSSKETYLNALKATNYDLLLLDLYFDNAELTASDIASLKTKANGGSRLVICYMSIGEAEDYRPYWSSLSRDLVVKENPEWEGNYVVKYWEEDWKKIIYKNEDSYTKKILEAGFDGVYLDIIEAYETFE